MSNLGYACINMHLSNVPKSQRVTTNRSMIKRTFGERGVPYASELALANCRDLLTILKWNHANVNINLSIRRGRQTQHIENFGVCIKLLDGLVYDRLLGRTKNVEWTGVGCDAVTVVVREVTSFLQSKADVIEVRQVTEVVLRTPREQV